MNIDLAHVELPLEEPGYGLTKVQALLRQMVLDAVPSVHSKRNYAKAVDDLFVFCASRPLTRALLMEYRTTMEHLSLRRSMFACRQYESLWAKQDGTE